MSEHVPGFYPGGQICAMSIVTGTVDRPAEPRHPAGPVGTLPGNNGEATGRPVSQLSNTSRKVEIISLITTGQGDEIMRVGTMLLKASLRCSVGCNVAVGGPPMQLRGVRFPPAFLLTERT